MKENKMETETESQTQTEPESDTQDTSAAASAASYQGPDHHKVTLIVDAKGNFTYSPTMLRVKPLDTIEFEYDGEFEVMFKERTPGNKLALWQNDSMLTIKANAEYAVYHYAAAVRKGERVFLDS